MKNKKAFPSMLPDNPTYDTGMELRDWFAGLVLQSILPQSNEIIRGLAEDEIYLGKTVPEALTKIAYIYADEMMKERNK